MEISVVGIVLCEEKSLFLKRSYEPISWTPPCGRLLENEDIIVGLKREIKEETGLDVNVYRPVDVWQGIHDNVKIISISYVCKTHSKQIRLSHEHSDFIWIDLKNLESMQPKTVFNLKKWIDFIEMSNKLSG